ncbi:hypothetical protein [Streptomyces sp. NBC_01235]|uniref:hypothetical protein n=1 Tax=Streptomyces sp. NBC_01235 TaxID=2903788 RepID=UPI002E1614D4|nr:hypothetical protein OG289_18325 [Streptomyces sp. NBC_01235]
MTAEHEDRAGHGGPAGGAGPDALMAAITGERLPDESLEDAAFMTEYRSATADIALLREQLGLVADTLLADARMQPADEAREHATAPVRQHATAPARQLRLPRRRLRPLALRAVGVAAAGALVLGAGWVVLQAGHGVNDGAADKTSASDAGAGEAGAKASEGAGSALGDPGYLACARLVVEGDVTDVHRLPGTTRERVTLRVTHAYKPARSAPEVDFVMEDDMDPLLGEGDHVLVALAKGAAIPDVWAVGEPDIASEREALTRALPDTEGVTCE